ncbi:MAG: hypothetical protein ABIP41_10310 [Croceibacterium sp.]
MDTELQPRIDPVTVAGLALLVMPVLTMAHEIGGHAATCVALGHRVVQLGAFYIDCDAGGTLAGRLVAAAGPAIDVALALVGYQIWKRASGDLARLVWWYVWLSGGFTAAGYFAFSGLTGIGDLNPGEGGGIGLLPVPAAFRVLFLAGGALAYWRLVVLGLHTLAAMIGQGPLTKAARRTVGHLFYAVLCGSAVLASLPNPIGLFITLASAAAASFGGHAGLISIGFATHEQGSPRSFAVRRSWPLLALGVAATAAFAAILGPTIRFG